MSKKIPPYIGPKYKEGGVLLVGRDPGKNEVEQGEPFVGRSGWLFNNTLAFAGLRREEVAIANRVPYRPPNNIFDAHKNAHIEEGWRGLQTLIDKIKPGVVVAMGNQAAYDLILDWPDAKENDHYVRLGRGIRYATGVMERRGFFSYNPNFDLLVLGTLHPAAALRNTMPDQLLLEADFKRLGKYLNGKLPFEDLPEVEVISFPHQLEPIKASKKPISWDIEVKWGGTEVLCQGFTGDNLQPKVAYYRSFPYVEPILTDPAYKLLCHNGSFDTYVMEYLKNIPVTSHTEDTIHLWWAMYPELAGKEETGADEFVRGKTKRQMTRKGLSFLAGWYLNIPYWKFYTDDPQQMGVLCGIDTWVTKKCYEKMIPQAKSMGVMQQYRDSVAMVPMLNKMMHRGLLIDRELYKERVKKLRKRQRGREKKAKKAAFSFLKFNDIKDSLWYKDARCECCFGGSKQKEHCPHCAGVVGTGKSGNILKSDLVQWAESNEYQLDSSISKKELEELLPLCKVCKGVGTIPQWDVNIMSPTQLEKILFEHLNVPKYICPGGKTGATEEIVKRVKIWASQ